MKNKIVAPIVKAAAGLAGVSRQELTVAMGLSQPQAVTNKYGRDSFTAQDLIKIGSVCGYRLAFVDSNGKTVLTFPEFKPDVEIE
jgi:hypothetical protein